MPDGVPYHVTDRIMEHDHLAWLDIDQALPYQLGYFGVTDDQAAAFVRSYRAAWHRITGDSRRVLLAHMATLCNQAQQLGWRMGARLQPSSYQVAYVSGGGIFQVYNCDYMRSTSENDRVFTILHELGHILEYAHGMEFSATGLREDHTDAIAGAWQKGGWRPVSPCVGG